MSFARKIRRARGMVQRRDRKRIQKDLRKKAQARDAAKTNKPPHLSARIENGRIVIDAQTADAETAEPAVTL